MIIWQHLLYIDLRYHTRAERNNNLISLYSLFFMVFHAQSLLVTLQPTLSPKDSSTSSYGSQPKTAISLLSNTDLGPWLLMNTQPTNSSVKSPRQIPSISSLWIDDRNCCPPIQTDHTLGLTAEQGWLLKKTSTLTPLLLNRNRNPTTSAYDPWRKRDRDGESFHVRY